MSLTTLSVIIPLAPDETQLGALLDDLQVLPAESEIIVVSCCEGQEMMIKDSLLKGRVKWVTSAQGRAIQQNTGAKAAQGEFLWFLHADSRVSAKGVRALDNALKNTPDALLYFQLKFRDDGPRGMTLNEWGVKLRCVLFKTPFGDQGFCLKRGHFVKVGGFPEQVPYGEDHLLVWYMRQAGHRVQSVGAVLETSARKYQQQGWGRLTLKYQILWIKQALPEAYKLLMGKQ